MSGTPTGGAPWTVAAPPSPGLPPPSSDARPIPIGRSPRGIALVVVATAVAVDLALNTVVDGVAAVAATVALALGLALTGWVVRPGGRVLLGVAVGLSLFLPLRSSPWVVAVDAATIGALIALACTAEKDGRLFDTRFGVTARRIAAGSLALVAAVPAAVNLPSSMSTGAAGSVRRRLGAIGRGVLIAAPLIVLVVGLLASADPVFAEIVTPDADLSGLPLHVAVTGLAALVALACFVLATQPPRRRGDSPAPIGPVEGIVVVGALTAVYAAFAASQLVVARQGPEFVEAATGLTYAQYARSGFFQLLWVAGLTAVVLAVMRSLVRADDRRSRIALGALGATASALTLVVVRAAILRLDLYEDAFGLTALRWWSSAFAWWLGAVFVLLGAACAARAVESGRPTREWLPMALGIAVVVGVVVVNVVDPDRTIADHDVARARQGADLDSAYLATLSNDAVPTLVDAVPTLDPDDAIALTSQLCARDRSGAVRWNRSDMAAADALERLCG